MQPQSLHPQEGSLMLYYDQLNVIAQHLIDTPLPPPDPPDPQDIHEAVLRSVHDPSTDEGDLGKFFTLKELNKPSDWDKWHQARYNAQQLSQTRNVRCTNGSPKEC
jgi:hypothetical protein